jgi:hypothetical protein
MAHGVCPHNIRMQQYRNNFGKQPIKWFRQGNGLSGDIHACVFITFPNAQDVYSMGESSLLMA